MPRPRSPRRHTRAQLRARQTHLTRALTTAARIHPDDESVDVLSEYLDSLRPPPRR